jgi:hypothetical protein
MVTRYAYIQNNNTIWGPGSNPYFITLTNGDIWEISAHTVQESEDKGIFVVTQVNQKEIDERFFRANTPVYSISNGKPIETWSYSFIPAARENMLEGVDEKAEEVRQSLTTKYAGQYAEYNEVYAEALEVKALPLSQTIDTGTYPYLDADIGVTFSPLINRVVNTVREAADLVVVTRDLWRIDGAQIRTARLEAKKNIRDAATDDAALQIFLDYCNSL